MKSTLVVPKKQEPEDAGGGGNESFISDVDREFGASVMLITSNAIVGQAHLWTIQEPLRVLPIAGTLTILHESGLGVTNHHVIQSIYGRPIARRDKDTEGIPFQVIASLPDIDIAFVKLLVPQDKESHPFVPVQLWNDLEVPKSTLACVLDYPLGLDEQAKTTPGIISGHEGQKITTTCPVNHGSSGSPLFARVKENGRYVPKVIGIISSGIERASSINLAVGTSIWVHHLTSALLQRTYRPIFTSDLGFEGRAASTEDLLLQNIPPTEAKGGVQVLQRTEIESVYDRLDLDTNDILFEIEFPAPFAKENFPDMFHVESSIEAAQMYDEQKDKEITRYGSFFDSKKPVPEIPTFHFSKKVQSGDKKNELKEKLEQIRIQYYPYHYKSSYPRFRARSLAPRVTKIALDWKESETSAWVPSEYQKLHNLSLLDVFTWIPTSTPLLLKYYRDSKRIEVAKLFEPARTRNLGIRELATPLGMSQEPKTEIISGMVLSDLTSDHVETCPPFSSLCVKLLAYAATLKQKGRNAVILTDFLPNEDSRIFPDVDQTNVLLAMELFLPIRTEKSIQVKCVFQSWLQEPLKVTEAEEKTPVQMRKKMIAKKYIETLEQFRVYLAACVDLTLKHYQTDIKSNWEQYMTWLKGSTGEDGSSDQWKGFGFLRLTFRPWQTVTMRFPQIWERDWTRMEDLKIRPSLFFKEQKGKIDRVLGELKTFFKFKSTEEEPGRIKRERAEFNVGSLKRIQLTSKDKKQPVPLSATLHPAAFPSFSSFKKKTSDLADSDDEITPIRSSSCGVCSLGSKSKEKLLSFSETDVMDALDQVTG